MAPAIPPPAVCIVQAEARYSVPANLIRSVLHAEGAGPGVAAHNHNGSEDLGWMQINTLWLTKLAPYGITRKVLLHDACINVGVGAWILQRYYLRFHDWTSAIRAYNVGPHLSGGYDYARRVITRWRGLALAAANNTDEAPGGQGMAFIATATQAVTDEAPIHEEVDFIASTTPTTSTAPGVTDETETSSE